MRHLFSFLVLLAVLAPPALAAKRDTLHLRPLSLELPGPPATLLSADLNGDGHKDLVVFLVYGDWISIGEDRMEGLVYVTEVVPSLIDRREIRAWLAGPGGTYTPVAASLPLPTTVIAAEAGPPGAPVLLLMDQGMAALRLREGALTIEPLVADPPAAAGASTFLPGKLGIVADVDGDRTADVVLPAREGPAVYLGTPAGLASSPATRLLLPGDRKSAGRRPSRAYPLPRVEDVNGDRVPDLIVTGTDRRFRQRVHVLRGLGGGKFAEAQEVDLAAAGIRVFPMIHEGEKEKKKAVEHDGDRELAWFGDLDGDGRAELVTSEEVDTGKSEIKQAKRPTLRYRFHHLQDLVPQAPYRTAEIVGHAFDVEDEDLFDIAAFQDLDADGRKDLVTVTLDFSMWQIVKIVTTKRLTLGLEFHVYHQGGDGGFTEVKDLDLAEKLKIDLNDLRIGRFAQFAGDFDGDGRADFVHLGRGKTVTIHRGQEGAHYPKNPDLSIPLEVAIEDLAQVRVDDLDGDGRADLAISRPGKNEEPGVLPPVTLDLYLSASEEAGR
ncbi:MAG TPA: VCBS repeat-containing protein [Candidatus Polarisedimenticolaceae bacterium]|nr:VCBS repeat-containing protein [Candidatus Polarisedimenticolaceae bacterium]